MKNIESLFRIMGPIYKIRMEQDGCQRKGWVGNIQRIRMVNKRGKDGTYLFI